MQPRTRGKSLNSLLLAVAWVRNEYFVPRSRRILFPTNIRRRDETTVQYLFRSEAEKIAVC